MRLVALTAWLPRAPFFPWIRRLKERIMKNERCTRTTRMAMSGIACALMVGAAQADILYDTTWMTNNQTYTGSSATQSYIGGAANNAGGLRDEQKTDDFTLLGMSSITSVTADFL